MTESSGKYKFQEVNNDLVKGEELASSKLQEENFSNSAQKLSGESSDVYGGWTGDKGDLYANEEHTRSAKIDLFLRLGRELLKEENGLNKREQEMLDPFKRLLDVSAKKKSLSTFYTEMEDSVESLFRLDFSSESKISDLLEFGENDLLNYIVMTVEMIRERLGQSVVSSKVVRSIMGMTSEIGVLVTDEQGRIRFANDKMSEFVAVDADHLVGASIKDYVSAENTLLNGAPSVRAEQLEVRQIKVPATNGEIDEWVYTFSEKVNENLNFKRISEARSLIEEISGCDNKDEAKMNALLESLDSKLTKLEEGSIPTKGLLKSGSNLRELIEDCLAKVDKENTEIAISLDAKESITFVGNDRDLKALIEQVIDCACQNLSASQRDSKLEIVVSSSQQHLLLTFMDNGAIASNYTLVTEMRESVKKIGGTLDLKSGRIGNKLSMTLPI